MAQRLTTQIASLIDITVSTFVRGMETSGKNAWNSIRPIINGLNVTDKKLSATQSPTLLQNTEAALDVAYGTDAHQARINNLTKPLEDIRRMTLRDFTRRFGLVSDNAIEQSKQLAANTDQFIQQVFSFQEFQNNIFLPVLISMETHIEVGATKNALLKDVEHRIVQGTQFFGQKIPDHFAVRISFLF